MINFADILKGNFMAEFSAITVSEMLIAIVLSFVGVIIVTADRLCFINA